MFNEWKIIKHSTLYFYPNLTDYFNGQSLDISLANEIAEERASAVDDLVYSHNFSNTHNAIKNLENYDDFTNEEANSLADAAISNTQVSWVVADPDVHNFFSRLITKHKKSIDPIKLKAVLERLNPS